MRLLCLIVLTAVAGMVSACGGGSPSSPPGSPDNPLVAVTPTPTAEAAEAARGGASVSATGRSNEGADARRRSNAPTGSGARKRSGAGRSSDGRQGSAAQPGYQAQVERQSSRPRSRFTPCNLVTRAQAGAIVGEPIQQPLEAPQGPTCIYRSRTGSRFITLAVLSLEFEALQRQMRRPQRIAVSSRTAYCGNYGQPMLYVPLSGGRVLSVAAPCAMAKRFATTALQRLTA